MDESVGGGPDSLYPGKLLHQAALWGNAELLEDLLHGDEIKELNTPDTSGRTALFDACTNADPACARILLQAGGELNMIPYSLYSLNPYHTFDINTVP